MKALNQTTDLQAAAVQPKHTIRDPQSHPTHKHLPQTLGQTLDFPYRLNTLIHGFFGYACLQAPFFPAS